jgi:hypothetical protein
LQQPPFGGSASVLRAEIAIVVAIIVWSCYYCRYYPGRAG